MRDVGVVGGGYAGLSAALLLSRAGHRVTLYERVAEPSAVGAGIVLQPTGLWALAELGVADELLSRGARLSALRCVNPAGKELFCLRYAELSARCHGLGMHRGTLFSALFTQAKRARLELCLGRDVKRYEQDARRVRLFNQAGSLLGEHELLVVADGARSELRRFTKNLRRARPYPWGALWFVAEDPEGVYQDELFQVADRTEVLFGMLPTGHAPGGSVPLVSLYWSLRMDTLEQWRATPLAAWKKRIVGYDPRSEFVLDQINDHAQVLSAEYVDVVMRPWHDARVVFIGDAAHATSPQLGQGTNLALWDAHCLAECLNSGQPQSQALANYSRRRRSALSFYQFASRALTPFFQSDYRFLGALRDSLMSAASRVGFIRRQMIRTMAGIKLGILRPSLQLAPLLPALVERASAVADDSTTSA